MTLTKPFRRYRRHTNAILPVSYDASTYIDANDVTLTTAASANVDAGLTLTGETQTATGWSALVTATHAGEYSFELWLTYSDGSRQVLSYVIDVVNP
jgi:hypothetical protein